MRDWNFKYEDLTEPQLKATMTEVEKEMYFSGSPEESTCSVFQRKFLTDGVLHLPKFIPDEVIENYVKVREKLTQDRSQKNNFFGGWNFPTPYMVVPSLKDISLMKPLMEVLKHLTGEEMGLHLNLTGWVSTERNFHSDSYLNPSNLWSNYLAIWIALEDIHPDSGPFQYVPGSHRWPTLRREKLFKHLTPEEQSDPLWPTFTQDAVAKACEEEIEKRGKEIVSYVPKKGDVLVWHSGLIHRGSQPKNPELLRKALICHYSALSKRVDMPVYKEHPGGGYYFDLPTAGAVR